VSRPRLPWQGVSELLVDGNNLLHALAGSADPGALRLLLARLQASVPPTVATSIILDGHPDPGSPARIEARRGIVVRHAGRVTADRALTDELAARPVAARAGAVVVTNDNELRGQVRRLGARAEPVAWLVQRLGSRPLEPGTRRTQEPAPPATSQPPATARSGRRRPPGSPPAGAAPTARLPADRLPADRHPADHPPTAAPGDEEDQRTPWSPGRGATRKRGNPRRPPSRRWRARPAG
jgi:hypothetical protein